VNGKALTPAAPQLQTMNFTPTARFMVALPASRQISVHRGGEMLSYCEAPQVSDLFAVYTGLKLISLLPHTSMLTGVAIDIVSIFSFQNEVLTRFYGKDVWLINEQTVNEVRF
jgi:hypothetical protein